MSTAGVAKARSVRRRAIAQEADTRRCVMRVGCKEAEA